MKIKAFLCRLESSFKKTVSAKLNIIIFYCLLTQFNLHPLFLQYQIITQMLFYREFDINQKIESCPSLTKFTSMAGFFSKKQYAAIADKELAIKLLNERCLECSICAMFFSSSLTISIKALFLSKILSAILISEFLILFLTLVTSCMPLRKRFSNRA